MIQRRPIGQPVPNFKTPITPNAKSIEGAYARLDVLDKSQAKELHNANSGDAADIIWTYLPYGPFETQKEYTSWLTKMTGLKDPYFYAIFDKEAGKYGGVASYLRIKPNDASIEVGHINFAPQLQHTKASTEAIFLMMEWAFEEGYRRFEWKCDALNAASMNAAKRYGFVYEGTFRQATMYKGRNRDTAWFAVIDKDWPPLKEAFEAWLDPSNFDEDGIQKKRLSQMTSFMAAKCVGCIAGLGLMGYNLGIEYFLSKK